MAGLTAAPGLVLMTTTTGKTTAGESGLNCLQLHTYCVPEAQPLRVALMLNANRVISQRLQTLTGQAPPPRPHSIASVTGTNPSVAMENAFGPDSTDNDSESSQGSYVQVLTFRTAETGGWRLMK